MYRVYDKKEKTFVIDDIYMSPEPYSYLYILKKTIFGNRLELASNKRYVCHKYIELEDKHGYPIFEGDIVKAQVSEDEIVEGGVAYAHELAAYVVLCFDSYRYYTLSDRVCDNIEIIGNVFDRNEESK